MRGRPPVPTHMKILRGNPGKRKLNTSEAKIETQIPPMPRDLDTNARKEWRRITKELYAAGLVTKVDRAALAAYCQCWSTWTDAINKVRTLGAVVKSPTGYPIQNPYLSIANTALKQMRSLLVEFGMTPSSRSRVKASPPGGLAPAADPWAEVG